VLQNHAKVYGDDVFVEGLTEEERRQRRRKHRRFGTSDRRLTLREEMSRAVAVLHLRSVARYNDAKLGRLINSSGGDLWIEVVRLCTAKIDALTLSLQIMAGTKSIAASPYGNGGDGGIDADSVGGLWSAVGGMTGVGNKPEPLTLGMAPGLVVGGRNRLSTNTARTFKWERASRNRSRQRWRLWFWPRWARGLRWWRFEFAEMHPVYAAARSREKLDTSYADLAVWALQEVDRQLDEHPWVNWPREANTKLEEAYQTEMQQIQVRLGWRFAFCCWCWYGLFD
jgi:hypothetical protein